ncbi:hypothetical protein DKT69_33600 [Micromonospora sicca]|uniref:Uncharacterized protein n=1 Tax=Micromonospora sicca TaxID=2202420 RepID=A0A317CZH4_9ACTN|nr:hypothetical protein DKT69_33600 [Micromonospora sp. 4G51]
MRGAGHGEVLPPRFLREPRQGQHQLTEHRVPGHGLLKPEHPVGMDQDIHQIAGREVQTWLNKVAKTCQCCAQGKGWDKPCTTHGEPFCEGCRDHHDINLVIDKQLQRVRGRLLHRATKTEESDAPLPLPTICVTALRHRHRQQETAKEKAGDAWHDTGSSARASINEGSCTSLLYKTRKAIRKIPNGL